VRARRGVRAAARWECA